MIKKEYIIFTLPYRGNSAGIRALWLLGEKLIERGFKVYSTYQTPSQFHLQTLSNWEILKKSADPNTVVIYPEVIFGNPFKAINVVRWCLNRPGFLSGDRIYAPDEMVFIYSEMLRNYVMNDIKGVLNMPTLDKSLFFEDISVKKDIETYYVGKGEFIPGLIDTSKIVEITRQTPPNRKDLSKLLQRSKVLYCFDSMTALTTEARACNTPVICLNIHDFSKEEMAKAECGVEGMGFGLDELEEAKLSLPTFIMKQEMACHAFESQLDKFIETTQALSIKDVKHKILADI